MKQKFWSTIFWGLTLTRLGFSDGGPVAFQKFQVLDDAARASVQQSFLHQNPKFNRVEALDSGLVSWGSSAEVVLTHGRPDQDEPESPSAEAVAIPKVKEFLFRNRYFFGLEGKDIFSKLKYEYSKHGDLFGHQVSDVLVSTDGYVPYDGNEAVPELKYLVMLTVRVTAGEVTLFWDGVPGSPHFPQFGKLQTVPTLKHDDPRFFTPIGEKRVIVFNDRRFVRRDPRTGEPGYVFIRREIGPILHDDIKLTGEKVTVVPLDEGAHGYPQQVGIGLVRRYTATIDGHSNDYYFAANTGELLRPTQYFKW